MIDGMLIKGGKASHERLAGSLSSLTKLIGCEYVEMPCRLIKGKKALIVCDEEGLLKSELETSAVCDDANERMVGALLVVGVSDKKGNLTSLSKAEMAAVQDAVDENGLLHYSIRN